MDTIEELGRRAGAAALAAATQIADPDYGLRRIVDDTGPIVPSVAATRPARRPSRMWALVAAAVAVIGIGSASVMIAGRDDSPRLSPDPTPTPITTAPAPTTAPETSPTASTVATTASPSTTSPPTNGLQVSYLDPPPDLALQTFATIERVEDGFGGLVVADDGVVVTSRSSELTTIGWDGARESFAIDVSDLWLMAGGPGDVVYGFVPGGGVSESAGRIIAVALAGDRTGQVVAAVPSDASNLVEKPFGTFGRGPSGLQSRYDVASLGVLMEYVATDGTPLTGAGTPDVRMGGDLLVDPTGSGLVSRTDGSQTWPLDIVEHPDTPDPFDGHPLPTPTAAGGAVLWRGIGPPASTGDFPSSSLYVIAFLDADGTGEWFRIPDGWSVLASDLGGTVLGRQMGDQLELAVPVGVGGPTVVPSTQAASEPTNASTPLRELRALAASIGTDELAVRTESGLMILDDRQVFDVVTTPDGLARYDGGFVYDQIDSAANRWWISTPNGALVCEVTGEPVRVWLRGDGAPMVTVERRSSGSLDATEVAVPAYDIDCATGAEQPLEPTSWEREAGSRAIVTVGDRRFELVGDDEGNADATNEVGVSIDGNDYAGGHTFSPDGSTVVYADFTNSPSPLVTTQVRARDTSTGDLLWSAEVGLTFGVLWFADDRIVIEHPNPDDPFGSTSTETLTVLDATTGNEITSLSAGVDIAYIG